MQKYIRDRCGRDRMVVGFTTTCAISTYHDLSCEFEPHSWRGVPDTTLCDKVDQLFDSKMADGDQLWSVPNLKNDLLHRNALTHTRKTDLIER